MGLARLHDIPVSYQHLGILLKTLTHVRDHRDLARGPLILEVGGQFNYLTGTPPSLLQTGNVRTRDVASDLCNYNPLHIASISWVGTEPVW